MKGKENRFLDRKEMQKKMALKKAKKMLSILLAGCMALTPVSGMAQAEMLDYETVQEDVSYDDAYAVGTADLEYPDEVFETGATLDEGAGELLDDEELLAEAEPEFQEETAESDLFADIPGETEDTGTQSLCNASANPMAFSEQYHMMQMTDLLDAIEQDRKTMVDEEEGRKPVDIILAAYESERTGRKVVLE